jgi:hypothetical protein
MKVWLNGLKKMEKVEKVRAFYKLLLKMNTPHNNQPPCLDVSKSCCCYLFQPFFEHMEHQAIGAGNSRNPTKTSEPFPEIVSIL